MNTKVATIPFVPPAISPAVVGSLLGVLLFTLLVLYMYFLSMSVVHVVLRKEIHQQEQGLRTEIARFESQYIEAQHQVSQKIATVEVLSETSEKIFVNRVAPTLVLSGTSQ